MCNTAHERLYIHRTVGTLKIVVERTVYCEVQRCIEVDRRMFIEQLVVLGHIVWYSSSSCQLSRDAGWSACVLQEVSSAVKEWPLERRSVEFDLDAMILCLLKINIFSGFVFIKVLLILTSVVGSGYHPWPRVESRGKMETKAVWERNRSVVIIKWFTSAILYKIDVQTKIDINEEIKFLIKISPLRFCGSMMNSWQIGQTRDVLKVNSTYDI